MTDHCLEESRGLSGETPQGSNYRNRKRPRRAQRPDQIGACTDRRAEGHCTGARPSGLFF